MKEHDNYDVVLIAIPGQGNRYLIDVRNPDIAKELMERGLKPNTESNSIHEAIQHCNDMKWTWRLAK